jgi:drug/metabolite transporter (DMT)-like permease
VLIALWARFVQGKSTKSRLWLGLALCLVGLAAVAQVRGQHGLDGLGVAAGIGAAVALSAYYLLGERAAKVRDPWSLTSYALLISAVAGAIVRPWWQFPGSVLAAHASNGVPTWLLIVFTIVLGTLIPYLLLAACLEHIPLTSAGIIGAIEPVVAAGVAWPVLDEVLTGWQVIGGLMVLTGVLLAETARTSSRDQPLEISPT